MWVNTNPRSPRLCQQGEALRQIRGITKQDQLSDLMKFKRGLFSWITNKTPFIRSRSRRSADKSHEPEPDRK
ncbi:hypothetical protein TNCT_72151 [Trichonephila clavata]|uniref:Uncharacterized protein n=1 Tax=Trichonephila clavata TaxID=2740835 RepID=A0A8X6KDZ9_TRICU|nr:hypothetical protein TNCT_72151 [Trichonephila clavata]